MAPNRKKKKATSATHRSYATVSIVSKSKVKPNAVEAPEADEHVQSPVVNDDGEFGAAFIDDDGDGVKDLSSVHLESHLEDSALQVLVDAFGENSLRQSSRQVSKLVTEKRRLRGQAQRLQLSAWLSPNILSMILDHVMGVSDGRSDSRDTSPSFGKTGVSTDSLTVRLWTLKRTLTGLGFESSNISNAVLHFLRSKGGDCTTIVSSSENIWGLEHCIDWLATFCPVDELPDYDDNGTKANGGFPPEDDLSRTTCESFTWICKESTYCTSFISGSRT